MKSTSNLFIAAVICLLALAACEKKKTSAKELLTGKWKITSQGYDANKNSAMDADETTALADTVSSYVLIDGTGTGMTLFTYKGKTDTALFTWFLKNSDKDMMGVPNGRETYIHDSNHIDQLSATDLRLTCHTFSTGLNWINLKKQ